jgi:hypothetical protein
MEDPGEFNDFEPEMFDFSAVEAYALELAAAVEIYGIPVLEPGEIRGN